MKLSLSVTDGDKCPKCQKGTMAFYDGALGYMSVQCRTCHYDVRDASVLLADEEHALILAALVSLEKTAKIRGDAITRLNCAKLYDKVRGV